MQSSANMHLTVWDLGVDPYDHAQLAANWQAVDTHNHTTNKGVQIPTGGIVDGAITAAKIQDGAITTAKIQPGAITQSLMDTAFVHPLGMTIEWWRPNALTSPPDGWVIPIGQTITAANHSFPGGGTITLPDLRNKFILGADLSGTGSGTTTPPAINQAGGSHTVTLSHTHTVDAHQHTIPGHSHTVNSHAHTVDLHSHGSGTLITDKAAARTGKVQGNPSGSLYADTVGALDNIGHGHQITGRTGDVTPGTSSSAPGTSSVSQTSDPTGGSTQSALSTVDIRPGYVGLLRLMKVKN